MILPSNDESDFTQLTQIGLFRDNTTDNAEVSYMLSDLVLDILKPENVLIVVELNHRGEEFIKDMVSARSEIAEYDIFYKNKKKVGKRNKFEVGLRVTKDKVNDCKKLLRNWNSKRIIITEEQTYIEATSFGVDSKGNSYEGLGTHDDIMMTLVNVTNVFGTGQYFQLLDEQLNDFNNSEYNLIEEKIANSIPDE